MRTGRGGRRDRARLVAIAALAIGLALPLLAAFQAPPVPTRWVTDSAGFLSEGTRSDLDARLEQWERETGHQFLVWITPTAGELSPEDFASQAFQAWRVGRKGIDDGLVLFVFANDRKLRFEVGYGLEASLPDALAGQILGQAVVPRLRAGDNDGGIRAGVEAAIAAIETGVAKGGGEAAASPSPAAASPDADAGQGPGQQLTLGQMILIGLLAIGFLILLITHPGFALWLLFNILSSGRGGGGGGGGGFSGGGGSSGGGGASGSW